MNAKQQQAAQHARMLNRAKQQLLVNLNEQMRQLRAQGYQVEATPQIRRLVSVPKFRTRDYNRIMDFVSSPEKLKEYIVATDTETGELVSGAEAISRYANYQLSAIYHAPKEIDVMLDRVSEEIEDMFTDDGTLQRFRQFVNDLISNPCGAISDEMKYALHPDWRKYDDARLFYAAEEMSRMNAGNGLEIRDALENLVEREGPAEVVRRIKANWETLEEECSAAIIAYRTNASAALQRVLIIFLPSDHQPGNIRHRMSDMQDAFDSQYEDYDYEE